MTWMIGHGAEFRGIPILYNDVAMVSTLAQLQAFIRKVSCGQVPMARKMRFCFWDPVKGLNLSYHNTETLLFTRVDPYYGNLN